MTDPIYRQLLGHLLGALDDDEQQCVDARLEHDPECNRELVAWRRRLAPLEAMRPDFEPPPGLVERTCRYVAAHMPIPASSEAWGRRRKMSPNPVPPSRIARMSWLDVAVATLLLVTAAAVILPAIDGSRFQMRVASCQNDLRQFWQALSQYGRDRQGTPTQLANNGRLTPAGVVAVEQLQDSYLTGDRRAMCPDAWLSAQGVLRQSPHMETQLANLARPATAGTSEEESAGPQSPAVVNISNAWPGTWRNGTTDTRRLPPSPAEVPLLADAPSADLPGQNFGGHRGRGQNVVFADGHADFLPTASRNTTDWLLSSAPNSAGGGISAPIVFVSDH